MAPEIRLANSSVSSQHGSDSSSQPQCFTVTIPPNIYPGMKFKVSNKVLDPRPETETLIEAALAAPYGSVLDLGVGSGCILVTLLAERASSVGLGVDVSEDACLQASANAVLHKVDRRADIRRSDWFEHVDGQFDLIVSNPPYLSAEEMKDIQPELMQHEPHMALTDGQDGLSAYRVIAEQAKAYLAEDGRVLVELGHQQGPAVRDIFAAQGWQNIHLINDLDGRNRVLHAQKL